MDGMEVLDNLQAKTPETPVVIVLLVTEILIQLLKPSKKEHLILLPSRWT